MNEKFIRDKKINFSSCFSVPLVLFYFFPPLNKINRNDEVRCTKAGGMNAGSIIKKIRNVNAQRKVSSQKMQYVHNNSLERDC